MTSYVHILDPQEIRIIRNDVRPYKTLADVAAALPAGSTVCTGIMYDTATIQPTQTFKVSGALLHYEDVDYYGFGWQDDTAALTFSNRHAAHENFISGLPVLVKNGAAAPLHYPAEIGGVRGRTALGVLPDGRIALHISTDALGACTVESLQKRMLNAGCTYAINLDGGGSVQATGEVNAKQTRTVYNYLAFIPKAKEGEGNMFKIALGAGHGARTAGKRCLKALDPNETREWWLNDRICDYVESYLKDYEGYSLLRLDDSDDGQEDVALATRTNKANAWGVDFYLSVHHNAGINGGSGGGITAYSYPGSKTGAEWRDEFYAALIEKTGLRGNRAQPKLTANFAVLANSKMPAVLLELGFMDSKTDVPIILTDDYAQKCAKAIVQVLVARGKLTKKAKAPDKLYKVQLGAFSQKANAEKLAKELEAKGYKAYIVAV